MKKGKYESPYGKPSMVSKSALFKKSNTGSWAEKKMVAVHEHPLYSPYVAIPELATSSDHFESLVEEAMKKEFDKSVMKEMFGWPEEAKSVVSIAADMWKITEVDYENGTATMSTTTTNTTGTNSTASTVSYIPAPTPPVMVTKVTPNESTMLPKGMALHPYKNIHKNSFEVFIDGYTAAGPSKYMRAVLTLQESDQSAQEAPTFEVRKETMQEFMDALWEQGLRPSNYQDQEVLKAVKAHLEDMRQIAMSVMDLKK